MKKLLLTTLAIISLVACSQTQTKIDLQKENLTGNVKSVRLIQYKVVEKFGQIEKGEIFPAGETLSKGQNNLIIFNEQGNKIESKLYHSDGSPNQKWTYQYDDKDNEIERNSYKSDGSLNEEWIYQYEYDKQGNWTKRISVHNNIPFDIIERQIKYY